jgi:large subunit ribosomal protein L15
MKLNDVNKGIHKHTKRLRVGRGPGSGRGRTAGRGNKGQGQLAGWSSPSVFEGGGTPLIRRIPKRGFHNAYGMIVKAVNVGSLAEVFAAGAEVTPETLRSAGLAKGIWQQVKILGNGEIGKALKVSAHHFSEQAKAKILAAGRYEAVLPGSVVAVPGLELYLEATDAVGNLTEERLTDILDSLKGHPAFEAINRGDPEAMGEANGWSREHYREASHQRDPKGREMANVCLGCDAYFEQHLKGDLERLRAQRMKLK